MSESSDRVWILSRLDFNKRGAVEIDVVLERAQLERSPRTAHKALEVRDGDSPHIFALSHLVGRCYPHEGGTPAAREGRSVLERDHRFEPAQQSANDRALHPAASSVDEAQVEHAFLAAGPHVFFDHRRDVPWSEVVEVEFAGQGNDEGLLGWRGLGLVGH